MTVQGIKMLDEEKAIEMLKAIDESDIADCYKQVIVEHVDENGEINPFEFYPIAAGLAFCNQSEAIPEIAREFVALAFLDEIENDNPDAMLNLGSLYYTGRMGEQNYAEAVKYYKMAHEHGNLIASENLGYCYYYGRDVEVDYKAAYHYFIVPALAGRCESMYKIGDMYANGLYVEENKDVAFMMYDKAYQSIDDDCDVVGDICLRMGNCFYYGNGCEKDIQTALFFYQRAELFLYDRIKNGDIYKKKALKNIIEIEEVIRQELLAEIEPDGFGL